MEQKEDLLQFLKGMEHLKDVNDVKTVADKVGVSTTTVYRTLGSDCTYDDLNAKGQKVVNAFIKIIIDRLKEKEKITQEIEGIR